MWATASVLASEPIADGRCGMDRRHPLTRFSADKVRVAPSVLAADFCRLGEEIAAAEAGGAEIVHVDIMDGHFVPNISIGPPVVASLRGATALPLDVHLMLTDPGRYLDPFLDAGADHITLHAESNGNLSELLDRIHGAGASAGMTLRPGTPAESLAPYLDRLDLILVMTVEPGFGGQSFLRDQVPKIRRFREMIDASGRAVHLEVDGGINRETVREVVAAGGRLLVAGNSVFRAPEGVAAAIAALQG